MWRKCLHHGCFGSKFQFSFFQVVFIPDLWFPAIRYPIHTGGRGRDGSGGCRHDGNINSQLTTFAAPNCTRLVPALLRLDGW